MESYVTIFNVENKKDKSLCLEGNYFLSIGGIAYNRFLNNQ